MSYSTASRATPACGMLAGGRYVLNSPATFRMALHKLCLAHSGSCPEALLTLAPGAPISSRAAESQTDYRLDSNTAGHPDIGGGTSLLHTVGSPLLNSSTWNPKCNYINTVENFHIPSAVS